MQPQTDPKPVILYYIRPDGSKIEIVLHRGYKSVVDMIRDKQHVNNRPSIKQELFPKNNPLTV